MKDFSKAGWEWREIPVPSVARHHPGFAFIQLAAPFFVAVALWAGGRPVSSEIALGVGVVLMALKFMARPVYDVVLAVSVSLARRLAGGLSYVGLAAAYVLLFAPVAFAARLLGRDDLQLRRRSSAPTYWTPVPSLDSSLVFDKPFLIETRSTEAAGIGVKSLRAFGLLYRTVLTLLLVNAALGYVVARVAAHRASLVDDRSQVDVYSGSSWAPAYFREFTESFTISYTPFIHWMRKDYAGRYINIKDGHRQTYQTSIRTKPPVRLYAFGASAMWGTGSRDDDTIPSYLVKFAERDGFPLAADNLAQSAFVNWQNVISLAELCSDGKIPDLVLFYEGAGDAGARLQETNVKRVHANLPQWQEWIEHHDDPRRWLTTNSLIHILGRDLRSWLMPARAQAVLPPNDPQQIQRIAYDVVTLYENQSAFVRKLADAYGFKVWFFWQPLVFTKKHPTALERSYRPGFGYGNTLADVYRAATEEVRQHDFAIDLSTIFDDQDQTIYIDWAHYGDLGHDIAATRIYREIRPTLEALAHAPSQQAQ